MKLGVHSATFVEDWSEDKNNEVFGKRCNPNYHGHNYELIVDVTGDVDETTGIVIDLKVLKDIIRDEIEEVLDHKNLNLDIPYFKKVIPTAENICIFIWDIMREKISNDKDISVTLYETPRNFVKYSGN